MIQYSASMYAAVYRHVCVRAVLFVMHKPSRGSYSTSTGIKACVFRTQVPTPPYQRIPRLHKQRKVTNTKIFHTPPPRSIVLKQQREGSACPVKHKRTNRRQREMATVRYGVSSTQRTARRHRTKSITQSTKVYYVPPSALTPEGPQAHVTTPYCCAVRRTRAC